MPDLLFRIEFYVPDSHSEVVKMALFEVGAGRVGDYDCCAWQTSGQGQFRPGVGSTPFIGRAGEVEKVEELKIELVCAEPFLKQAVEALLAYHPYEEPAYSITRLETL